MTAERTPADLRRTALHEAAHAVASTVLGDTLEVVSIRPGQNFNGISISGPSELPEGFDCVPACAQPAELRAVIERRVLILLAGDVAAFLLGPLPDSDYRAAPPAETVARAALDALGPRLSELLIAHEQSTDEQIGDEGNAGDLAGAFLGGGASAHYLEWLRAETGDLVARYARAIVRVADELERVQVLRGEQVRALVYPPTSPTKGNSNATP